MVPKDIDHPRYLFHWSHCITGKSTASSSLCPTSTDFMFILICLPIPAELHIFLSPFSLVCLNNSYQNGFLMGKWSCGGSWQGAGRAKGAASVEGSAGCKLCAVGAGQSRGTTGAFTGSGCFLTGSPISDSSSNFMSTTKAFCLVHSWWRPLETVGGVCFFCLFVLLCFSTSAKCVRSKDHSVWMSRCFRDVSSVVFFFPLFYFYLPLVYVLYFWIQPQ